MTATEALEQRYLGREVGSFRIKKLIGEGGMGAVFLAEHRQVNLRVAFKFLRDPLANEESIARFMHEAQVLSRLAHPSLVRMNDCGVLPDGTLYLQMEHLDGQSLQDYLEEQGGKLPEETVLRFGKQVASALACVHQEQILHRDLKPSNLHVVADREVPGGLRVKVLDFGIAKLRQTVNSASGVVSKVRTVSGQIIGTPKYMSPEQCEGTSDLDDRSDVYSLGLILFELVTGESPYPESKELTGWLFAHIQKRPRTLRQVNPAASESLVPLLDKMLDKLAAQRPSMAEVEAQLGALLKDAETGKVPRRKSPVRRSTAISWTLAALGILGISGLAVRSGLLTAVWSKLRARPGLSERMAALLAMQARAPRGTFVIPGGRFMMGSTEAEIDAALADCQRYRADCRRDEYERERPQHVVTVSDFYLDQNEVTNAEYATFLNQPLRPTYVEQERLVYADRVLLIDLHPRAGDILYQNGLFSARPGAERKPVIQVTWNGAQEFCAVQGKRLPREAEWELAARSGKRAAPFPWTGWALSALPWGDATARCNSIWMARASGQSCFAQPTGSEPITEVGPQSIGTAEQDRTPQGVNDLAGNVREWVEDEFRIPYPDCGECLNPSVGTTQVGGTRLRVVRGGSFQQEPTAIRSAGRSRWRADFIATGIGFRCAANPERPPPNK